MTQFEIFTQIAKEMPHQAEKTFRCKLVTSENLF